MLPYNRRLKTNARSLRTKSTDAELHLGHRLPRKQILGVQFYRQKPIANYIANFMHRRQNSSSNSMALSIWCPANQNMTHNGPRDLEQQGLKTLTV
jgi:hypothetical protein